jgi:hypothetical protein
MWNTLYIILLGGLMIKILPFVILSLGVFGGEDLDVWNKYRDGLYKAAKAYVTEFSTEKDWNKWNDNINARMETRSLKAIALDWFSDNRSDLEDKTPSAIVKACFFFIKFVETKTLPPASVRANITEQNMEALQGYLEQCVEQVKVDKEKK